MKILAIVSSNRRDGNTARVVRLIGEQLKAIPNRRNEPLDFETVFLADAKLEICRGCRICFDRGEENCPLKDDLLSIRAKMQEADGLILASPVYVEDVNGIMKNWIDRMAFLCHRPGFAGKAAYFVTTSGSISSGHTIRTMSMALGSWGYANAGGAKFQTGALMSQEEIDRQYTEKTARIARRLYMAIHTGKALKPSFLSLMMFKILQKYWTRPGQEDTADYRYWMEWSDPKCRYYLPCRAGFVKAGLAGLAARIISKFV